MSNRLSTSPIPSVFTDSMNDMGHMRYGEITFAEWDSWHDHPNDLCEKEFAQSERWSFFRKTSGALRQHLRHVVAADFDGQIYKMDGHSRTKLWRAGELAIPDTLYVTIYVVRSSRELDDLYRTFNSLTAVETSYDIISHAFFKLDIHLESTRLKKGFIADALNIALRGTTKAHQETEQEPLDLYQAVAVFKQELLMLDKLNPPKDVYQSGVIAASLIGLALYPESQLFFEKISNREVTKQNGLLDPVEAVLTQIDAVRQKQTSRAKVLQADLCARTLRALQAWINKDEDDNQYWFKNKIRAADITGFIHALKEKKSILEVPHL